MRINVAKEDVYLCRVLAVEVRRVKCVFPRNKVQKETLICLMKENKLASLEAALVRN